MGPTDPPAQVFADALKWHARNLVIGVTRNWGKTVVNWNLALDPAGGPHNGGCDTCTGVITVGPGQAVTRNAEYFTLGHLARFVGVGAERIASTSFGTTGWNGQIMDVAFRNPDGSTALVVHNENDDQRTFAVAQGGHAFEYTLPGGALATFTWPADPSLDDGHELLDAEPMRATAVTPDDAENAVDDDATTRWASGAAQAPGQWLELDLGATETIRRVVLEPASTGPTSRAATSSTRAPTAPPGAWWRPARATASSRRSTSRRPPRATSASSRRRPAAQWWSVADVRVYG